MKFALTVAGFDPTGGAGVLRDILTFREFGIHGCSIITANTAQNTKGVKGIVFESERLIVEQLELLEEEIRFCGVKIGLPHRSLRVNEVISERLKRWNIPVVFDPVLSPTFGEEFISDVHAVKPLIDASLVLTPNYDEFNKIGEFLKDFKGYVAVTGIVEGSKVKDLLMKDGVILKEISHRKDEKIVRGTGCAFSSSLLSFLVSGFSVEKSFEKSIEYLKDYRKNSFKTEKMKQYFPVLLS